MTRVAICIPSGDDWKADFGMSLLRLLRREERAGKRDLRLQNWRSSLLPHSREMLAKEAIKDGAEWLLWLDSDSVFPEDTLECLLSWNTEVVGTCYATRGAFDGRLPVARAGRQFSLDHLREGDRGLLAVDRMGFGTALIHANVFRRIPNPWFLVPWHEATSNHIGEDVWFCMRAAEVGHSIYVDCDLSRRCGHVGTFLYGESPFSAPADFARRIWTSHAPLKS